MYEANEPTPKNTLAEVKPSLAVSQLREAHLHDAANAEEHAERIAAHIQAIDEELEALSEERRRLADECLKACEESQHRTGKYTAVAKNDYRDPLNHQALRAHGIEKGEG